MTGLSLRRGSVALAVASATFSVIGIFAEDPLISFGCGVVGLLIVVAFAVRALGGER